jgi:hypothetical protein
MSEFNRRFSFLVKALHPGNMLLVVLRMERLRLDCSFRRCFLQVSNSRSIQFGLYLLSFSDIQLSTALCVRVTRLWIQRRKYDPAR